MRFQIPRVRPLHALLCLLGAILAYFLLFGDARSLSRSTLDYLDLQRQKLLDKHDVIAAGTELRVLPLGDSITLGASDRGGCDSYRRALQRLLVRSALRYVGSLRCGAMPDNYNDGWPGLTVDKIRRVAAVRRSLAYSPNVVLLYAGVNDLALAANASRSAAAPAAADLGLLLDDIFAALPTACVLVALLMHAGDARIDAQIQDFNALVPDVLARRADAGRHALAVDMSGVPAALLADDVHPTEAGYREMAALWYGGLREADRLGWIAPPVAPLDRTINDHADTDQLIADIVADGKSADNGTRSRLG